MLISKFDLYKSEWLELVFDSRNKMYGAYELRQHYNRTLVKAMAVTFLSIIVVFVVIGMIIKPVIDNRPLVHITPIRLTRFVFPAQLKPPHAISHPHTSVRPPAATVPQKVFVPLVVTANPVTTEPPKVTDLPGNIGPVAVTGPGNGVSIDKPGTGTTTSPDVSNDPVDANGLDRMPEPIGGAAGWQKFLQKNLRYPNEALNNQAQGKVWLSFIVERDGHLTDIKIERSAGFGMDEEALRVLKLAPAWKPGIQNGHSVRVKYNIPINFQMENND